MGAVGIIRAVVALLMRTVSASFLYSVAFVAGCDFAQAESAPRTNVPVESVAALDPVEDSGKHAERLAGDRSSEPGPELDELPPYDGPRIEDPSGTALASFYAALSRTEADRAGAITRVLHMGDSSIGLDGLPHALRTRMMDRFGDAGPGFVLIDKFSDNYKSNVAHFEARGWNVCYIAYLCKKDGHYGLGGHTFVGKRGSWARVRPRSRGQYGRTVSRFEVWYAGGEGGGQLQLGVDRAEPVILDTRSDGLVDRWYTQEVEPGSHTLELRAMGRGRVRVYGVVMENDGPGVVWDTVSMIGAFTKRLTGFDPSHIREQIRRRKPDLLVLNYGGNDLKRLVTGSTSPEGYKQEFAEVLHRLRGDDGPPCLVVGIIDHGRSGRLSVEPEHVASLVTAQREVAFEQGCAFFDSVAAMGGEGSIRRWHSQRLAAPDLKHLNHRGRDKMGQLMFDALMAGYAAWKHGGR